MNENPKSTITNWELLNCVPMFIEIYVMLYFGAWLLDVLEDMSLPDL